MKKFIQLVTRLALVLTAVACGLACARVQSSPTGGVNTQMPSFPAFSKCPGCVLVKKPIALQKRLNVRSFDARAVATLQIVVDQEYLEPRQGQSQLSELNEYFGRASFVGTLRLVNATPSMCNAPPGDYQIRPLTVSYVTKGAVSGGTFEAVGPIPLIFRIMTVRNSQNSRREVNIIVDSVDYRACDSSIWLSEF